MTNEPDKHPMLKLEELVLRARKNQQKKDKEKVEKNILPLNYEEELKRHEEIHKRAAILEEIEEEKWRTGKALNMPKK